MGFSLNFYLSFGALLVGIVGGVYFLIQWLTYSFFKPALFWGIGMLCLFIFQIPTVLANIGFKFTLTEFNPFFFFAVSVSFVGVIAVYFGIISLMAHVTRKLYMAFSVWLVVALAFFSYFFVNSMQFTNHFPAIALMLLFFLPVNILSFIQIFRLRKYDSVSHSGACEKGLVMLAWSLLCSIGRNIIIMWGFIVYPSSFWFLALQSQILFWLQLGGAAFFIIGFILMRRTILSHSPLPFLKNR